MKLAGLDHVALGVDDLERAAKWYVEVLGFVRMHENVWRAVPTLVGIGGTGIALFPRQKRKEQTDDGIRHVAFRATRADFLGAQRELKDRSIPFEFEGHEVSHSIYFRDPEGNQLEITTYELE